MYDIIGTVLMLTKESENMTEKEKKTNHKTVATKMKIKATAKLAKEIVEELEVPDPEQDVVLDEKHDEHK